MSPVFKLSGRTSQVYVSISSWRETGLALWNFNASSIAKRVVRNGPRSSRNTHIHVPGFLDDLGPFRTTRFAIEDALKFHKANPVSRQLEIETYTWDVLPDSLKTGDIVDYVCRELEWVQEQLQLNSQ